MLRGAWLYTGQRMSLTLPSTSTPDNMRLSRRVPIDSDVFNICERIKEVSPALLLYALEPPVKVGNVTFHFSITEQCADGVERLVFRAQELDARIIERLERLLHIPFEERFAAAEREEKAHREAHEAQQREEMYERIGRPMLTDLEKCGFIQRGISYPKRGVRAR